jgi:6-phosphogluconolactonase (cycloisomerase 2 family)
LVLSLLTTIVARADGGAFTVSNEAQGNRVIAFERERDGALVEAGSYPTGGKGTGASLQSQGALALTEDGRFLLVVDAGSNELSSFAVHGAALSLRSRVSSHGTRPVSVAVDRGVAYVVNAGAPSNISGYELDALGRLQPLAGSVRTLSAPNAAPGQIAFSPDGRTLLVSERSTNKLLTFSLDPHGRPASPRVFDSAGMTPFGFAFRRAGEVFVSEAATKSLSSYELDRRGDLSPISKVVISAEAAPCWVTVSHDQRTAFVANAGSASISSYAIERSGAVTLAAAEAGHAGEGSAPQDMALAPRGDALYLLDRGNAGIARFDAHDPNALEYQDLTGELPPFASGLVVY